MEELGTLARSLKQKAEGLRRSGVRYFATMKVRQDVPAITNSAPAEVLMADTGQAEAPAVNAVPAPHVLRDAATALAILAKEVVACTRCAELARCRKQTVFGVGNARPDLCFVG